MVLKIKNIPFVGGDTMTFEFDYGTKVANSMLECPMKIYSSYMSSIQTPSSKIDTALDGWREENIQSELDKIKTQDGVTKNYGYVVTNGAISQIMIELDLTPLCNSLFSGSNSALKAAVKGLNVDVWAKGQGVSNGVLTNKCVVCFWEPTGGSSANQWISISPYGRHDNNPTSNIANISSGSDLTSLMNSGDHIVKDGGLFINASNKIYFIITSNLPSDGTIASEVDMDYINIKLSLARTPDVTNPIPITLPDTWSMLIKGFSPAWDSTTVGKMAIQIYPADGSGACEIQYTGGKFNFIKWIGAAGYFCSRSSLPFDKFNTFNFLIEQTATGKRMRVLQNNKTVEKYIDMDTNKLSSSCYLCFNNRFNATYADAFFNSVIFLPNRNFDDDTEAEAVLQGTADGFENDELVTDGTFQNGLTDYPIHGSGILVSPGKATFTTMGSYINQSIPVLPNNKYILDIEGNCANGIGEYINGIYIGYHNMMKGEFITGPHTTRINISMYPTATGQYVTSVSFKLKM